MRAIARGFRPLPGEKRIHAPVDAANLPGHRRPERTSFSITARGGFSSKAKLTWADISEEVSPPASSGVSSPSDSMDGQSLHFDPWAKRVFVPACPRTKATALDDDV